MGLLRATKISTRLSEPSVFLTHYKPMSLTFCTHVMQSFISPIINDKDSVS